ncbi:FMN reductase [Arboricoccus pini]|uniref:FMN reductase n=1 Tax=Arboricoccus pini TaxID=1963835 RepID=A0A212RLW4_9PROT|nr:NAD(P)H-dependent oxidoreductase [Arboricoccus pini]SNB73332.1 FMN reductase [Arboricoccus pini]
MTQLRILGINGSLRKPSRTGALTRRAVDALALALNGEGRVLEIAEVWSSLAAATEREELHGPGKDAVQAVETADFLVVASPVYRASYRGSLKHLFDLVHRPALSERPVLLLATGGSPGHGLVLEHQLRPLMAFFNALTLPTAIYATETDFAGTEITNPAIAERLERAVAEAKRIVGPRN